MKFLLLFLFCTISLTASAQWYKFKNYMKVPSLPAPHSIAGIQVAPYNYINPPLHALAFLRSDYSLELAEAQMMKTAQYHMRFRMYDTASYNFNQLAQLFAQQSRLSEAKWYYLQSMSLSRQQNNTKLTLSNLVSLALVKLLNGDFTLAQADLMEARDIASSKGWLLDVIEVEKKLTYIQHNRMAAVNKKRYADEIAEEN